VTAVKLNPREAGLFELLDRIIDQGIFFDAWARLLLPTAKTTRVVPVHVWTYLHFGELAA
ncbi:MAG TPA: hypothetical protein VG759_22620, partial [Candidatus Angelobacter sp.]|nr:hypothetical protein [Candidatus Angelobacter sp.]